jgi:hypothetical protein
MHEALADRRSGSEAQQAGNIDRVILHTYTTTGAS